GGEACVRGSDGGGRGRRRKGGALGVPGSGEVRERRERRGRRYRIDKRSNGGNRDKRRRVRSRLRRASRGGGAGEDPDTKRFASGGSRIRNPSRPPRPARA